MRTTQILSALILGTGIVAGGAYLLPAFAQSEKPAATAQTATTSAKDGMSVGQIHDKLVAEGYRDIGKIERERDAFEVKAVDKNGARVKLYLDPQTGNAIESRQKDRKQDARRNRRSPDTADTTNTTNATK